MDKYTIGTINWETKAYVRISLSGISSICKHPTTFQIHSLDHVALHRRNKNAKNIKTPYCTHYAIRYFLLYSLNPNQQMMTHNTLIQWEIPELIEHYFQLVGCTFKKFVVGHLWNFESHYNKTDCPEFSKRCWLHFFFLLRASNSRNWSMTNI